MAIKFCTKCGKKFESVGREVICPACKQAAAEESKRAAVLRAKRASWTGESVPVRISGRASTVIRKYGAAHDVPFAEALDELLKASAFFQSTGKAWESVEPYRSHRRKSATETTSTPQDEQDAPQGKPQDVQEVKTASKPQAAQAASKPQEVKQAASKPQEVKQAASKPQEVKQAAKQAGKVTTSTTAKKTAKTSKTAAGKKEGKKA